MVRLRQVAIAGSLLLLGLILGPLGWLAWSRQPQNDQLVFYRPSRPAIAALTQRVRDGESADDLGRIPIELELARLIFGLDHPYNRYDPQAYYTHEPDLNARCSFKEHPDRAWTMRTNSLGMRRDSEPSVSSPDLRVLVVGDSHVAGICNNSENLCAIAESVLEANHPGASIEVLNAARGGYSFWNYLGVLEKYLSLSPDVVVVTVFGGNDFTDVLLLAHVFEGTISRGLKPESKARREEALDESHYLLGQGYGTLLFFKDRPAELDFSLDASRRILEQIALTCSDSGAELLVMYLPSPLALPFEEAPRKEARVRAILDLDEEDLAFFNTLAARFLSTTAELGITTSDLTLILGDCADRCFWETDLHLSVHGHRRVGRHLASRLQSLQVVGERLRDAADVDHRAQQAAVIQAQIELVEAQRLEAGRRCR